MSYDVLGIQGFFSEPSDRVIPSVPRWFFHDAAAVLARDGMIIAAAEQERFDRIKHSNEFPRDAVRYCLDSAGLAAAHEVDAVAFPWTEQFADTELALQYIEHPSARIRSARSLLCERLAIPENRVHFVEHHLAHAHAAFYHSGFREALVVVVDGQGDSESTSIYSAADSGIELVKSYPISLSLGFFYRQVTRLLGYSLFDEYKVMGLAPYGDGRYRDVFQSLLALKDGGEYSVNTEALVPRLLEAGYSPRRKHARFSDDDKAVAKAAQEALERMLAHIVSHWVKETGAQKVCLAGGVAHNCAANGDLLRSKCVKSLFVHPASHDAGAALGAALAVANKHQALQSTRVSHVYWGPALEDDEKLPAVLAPWSKFVRFERISEIEETCADLLVAGKVIGWCQGRAEFGPRALGNRSILADPRPFENRDRINRLVKMREAYRPFAPVVCKEEAVRFFDVDVERSEFGFMGIVAEVRQEEQNRLGAITHVDGTARVQTIAEQVNPRLWKLLKAFERRTGIPMLLNTSFNNNYEPIVTTARDALRTLLTTDLDVVVLGNFLVQKVSVVNETLDDLRLMLTDFLTLQWERRIVDEVATDRALLRVPVEMGVTVDVPQALFSKLQSIECPVTIREFLAAFEQDEREAIRAKLFELWQARIIECTAQ